MRKLLYDLREKVGDDPCNLIQQLLFMMRMILGLTLGVGLILPANITSSVFRTSILVSLFFGCGSLNVLPESSSLVGLS
jgi:hypothetical protein